MMNDDNCDVDRKEDLCCDKEDGNTQCNNECECRCDPCDSCDCCEDESDKD